MTPSSRRAVFLDRDGVINKKAPSPDYVKTWDEFSFLPGVVTAIRRLNEEGFLVIVVSNQRGVARGLVTERRLRQIHARMVGELGRAGARIDGVFYCPHDLEDACECRKPQPGLLIRAAQAHDVDLRRSWMVGDQESDIEAGTRAGCKTILISPKRPRPVETGADAISGSLPEAVRKIVRSRRRA
jgi:histidinol-phosphate phosphatase family protein